MVWIADVGHDWPTWSGVVVDASGAATSVYAPRRGIPMRPERLSTGLCSLNPGGERLCMVCDMLINAKGKTHASQF